MSGEGAQTFAALRRVQMAASTLCFSSSADLLRAVTDRPEDLVALRGWRAAKKGLAKKWIDVFPDNLSFFGDLEESTERGLGNQCIAVREALGIAHAR